MRDLEYDAHRRTDPDGTVHTQTVYDHLLGTASRGAQCLRPVGLEQAGYLAGLLHDMGKYTAEFRQYLAAEAGRAGVCL